MMAFDINILFKKLVHKLKNKIFQLYVAEYS